MNDQEFWKSLRKAYDKQIPQTDSTRAWEAFESVLDQNDLKQKGKKRIGIWFFVGISALIVSIFFIKDEISKRSHSVSNLLAQNDNLEHILLDDSIQEVLIPKDEISSQIIIEDEELMSSAGYGYQRTFTTDAIIGEEITVITDLIDSDLSRNNFITKTVASAPSVDLKAFEVNDGGIKNRNVTSEIVIKSNGKEEIKYIDMHDRVGNVDFLTTIFVNAVSEKNELLEFKVRRLDLPTEESISEIHYLFGISFNTGYQNQRSIVKSSALGIDLEGRVMWKGIYVSALARALNVKNKSYVLSQNLGLYDPNHISLRNSILEEIDINSRYLDIGLSLGCRLPLWSRLGVEVATGIVKKAEFSRKVNYQILNNLGRQEVSLMSQTVGDIPIYNSIEVTALVLLRDNIDLKFTYNRQFHLFMKDIKYPNQEIFNTGLLIAF